MLDACATHDWDADLFYKHGVWVLEIRDGEELIARSRCGYIPPRCFRHLGSVAKRALERSGKLR